MDNICHTLVGAAMGEAGLKHRTRFGNAALMVSANLPDVDVLVFFTDTSSLSFRRGVTHGLVAQLLLPVLLTGVCWMFARIRPPRAGLPPFRPWWLLLLSYAGVYSHVFLDYLNTYGVRLLPPFDWRWFYGDAVFIIDPWLWIGLAAGVWWSRRRRAGRPARVALAVAMIYIVAMLASARAARGIVDEAWREAHGRPPAALMVGPMPVVPLRREVIVDAGDYYQTGRFDWPSGEVAFGEVVPKNIGDPAVAAARSDPAIRAFLRWARFPFWTLRPSDPGTRVTVADMRFRTRGALFTATTVVQPAP